MSIFKKCRVDKCENEYNTYKGGRSGYCSKHYHQMCRYGKILERTKFDPNEIIDCSDYYEICLYKGRSEQVEVARALIDKEDLKKVKKYKWSLRHGYVINVKHKLSLHQLILGNIPIKYLVDHRDTDPLNNRKYNLRSATKSQNGMNRKSKGYTQLKGGKWMAQIKLNYKNIYLGIYKTKKEAKKVAREARQKYFGKYAYKNNN